MMRRRWMRCGAVGAVAVVALTGCVEAEEPVPSLPTTASAEPISEDELTTFAVQTAEEFVALTDRAFTELEVPPELYDITTDEIAANLAADVESYIDQGYRLEGSALLVNATATSVTVTSGDSGSVAILACLDTSGSVVLDVQGNPVSGGGSERRPVTFDVRWQNESGVVTATGFPGESDDPECV